MSLMKLIETGELELSTPINSILPFEVKNPHYPDSAITVEYLARHTSSILYDNLEEKSWYLEEEFNLSKRSIGKAAYENFSAWSDNESVGLGVFLEEHLSFNGKNYTKNRFSKNKPGQNYEYSNIGAALAAYIVELKTGIAYRDYIERFTSEYLGFKRGVWRSKTPEELPTTYFQNQIETPPHYPILYPAGGMMLSCDELSSYLIEMIKGYQGESSIAGAESFQTMMSSENETSGIFWEVNGDKIGHNGGNYGVTCLMSFNRKTGIGKLFMTNISSYKNDHLLKQMVTIWNKMSEFE